MYLRRGSRYVIDPLIEPRKDEFRKASGRGETKITWTNLGVPYEAIHTILVNGNIKLEDVQLRKVDEEDFTKIKNRCISTQ